MKQSILFPIFILILTNLTLGLDFDKTCPAMPAPEDLPNLTHPWAVDDLIWTPIDPTPVYLYRSANGVLGDYFYIFGCQNSIPAYAYDLNNDEWVASTPPLLGNCNWCGVPTDDAFYIIGRYCSGNYSDEVQKFTPIGGGPAGTWEQVADYPHQGCGIAAAWDGGNYIYACGGGTLSYLSTAYKYDISADEWIPIANLPIPMKYHGGCFAQGKFIAYGGLNTSFYTYLYHPEDDTWSSGAQSIYPVYFGLFNTACNGVQVFSIGAGGGYLSHNHQMTDPPVYGVQIYDPATDSWSYEGDIPQGILLNSAKYIGNSEVISAGGYPTTYNSYKASGFPLGTDLSLIPQEPNIQIPPEGGSFEYVISLKNCENLSVEFELWIKAVLPNGRIYGPIRHITSEIAPGDFIAQQSIQAVPGNAPPGEYTYKAYVGIFPGEIWDQANFEFEKLNISE